MGRRLPAEGWQRAVLLGCAVLACLHQATHWNWFIEDSAICFAYARNLVDGLGAVPFPGGERVEGYSDPTWILLLAVFQAFGLTGFVVAKPLSMLFGALSVPVVWRSAHLAMDEDDGGYALVAPFALAVYAQHAIWSSSGLENGLFCFVLAAATLATVEDARAGRFARSALLWLVLTWSRPEGIAYAAIGGCWWLGWLVARGHRPVRPLLGWLALFFVPTIALESARLAYFAWPHANTYYGKLAAPKLDRSWNGRGWEQLRDWAGRLWYGWMFPVYLLGLGGRVGRGPRVLWAVALGLAVLLLWPGPEAIRNLWLWPDLPRPPAWYADGRAWLLVAGAVAFPLVALRSRGADVLGLCWLLAAFALGFGLYASGDWMHAYRWMSFATPSAAVLFAAGVREVAGLVASVRPEPGVVRLAVALLVFGLVPPNASQTRDHWTWYPFLDETPSRVRRRGAYTTAVARRVFWEEPIVALEMDMGAHLWWFPEQRYLDMAGLVDVPMSRHWYHQPAFVEEYVFREHQPTFGHVHGHWAEATRFERFEGWQEMVEIPPYDDPETDDRRFDGRHPGMWANRAIFAVPRWAAASLDGVDRRVAFAGGVALEGLNVPAPVWPAGGEGYVEVGLTRAASEDDPEQAGRPFRLLAFLAGGPERRVVVRDLDVGYGDLYPVREWRTGREVFVGRHPVRLPDDLPPGDYVLGLVVLDADGAVLPARIPPLPADVAPPEPRRADPDDGPPLPGFPRVRPGDDRPGIAYGLGNDSVLAEGEVRFAGLVRVAPRDEVRAAGREVLAQVAGDDCEEAEVARIRALRHLPRDRDWRRTVDAEAVPALAACWARRAEADPERAPRHLARSHRWDPRSPELARVGGPIGDDLWQRGLDARAAGDPEAAYAVFRDLLAFQPWRAWARRYAEEARDQRLGLVGEPPAPPEPPAEPGEGADAPQPPADPPGG